MSEYACDLEMAQNSNRLVSVITCVFPEMAHIFSSKNLRWLTIRSIEYFEFTFSTNFELSQDFRA